MHLNLMISKFYVWISELKWQVLLLIVLLHMILTYAGFAWTGEEHLLTFANFVYFYGTTAATIGYGDLSPQSPAGRLFATAFLFPAALVLFTIFIAKSTSAIATIWRKRMNGFGDFSSVTDATVIIGYHALRTPRIIKEIQADQKAAAKIILVSTCDVKIDHSEISYVRTESLSSQDDLIRAGILNAKTIVVYGLGDDQTLSAALAASALNDRAHLVAHFDEQEKANLLRAHTKSVCVVSQAVEVMVREMHDPGVADILNDLSSAQTSVTLFSVALPDVGFTAGSLSDAISQLGGSLISHRDTGDSNRFCLKGDQNLFGGTAFYLADERISAADISSRLKA